MITYYCSLMETADEKDRVEEIYHRYKNLIKYIALLKLKNEQLAEDAVHDVMLAVIRSIKKLQHCTDEELKSFLYLVIRNVAVDILRKEKRRAAESIDDLPLQCDPLADPQQQIGERAVRDCIAAMPPIYRDALELTVYYGCSAKEAARLLNITPAAARKRLERARAMVRAALEEGEMQNV